VAAAEVFRQRELAWLVGCVSWDFVGGVHAFGVLAGEYFTSALYGMLAR
jgi:hypothetical protein